MDNNQNRIDELKKDIIDNNIDLKQIYQSVGERISSPGVFTGENEEISGKLKKLTGIDSRISDLDVQIEDLRNSFTRIAKISDREKDIGEEYSALDKENRKLFFPIGKAAFIEWKQNPTDELSKLMTSLKDIEEIIAELDSEIFQLNNNEIKKSILNRIKDKTRITFLSSKKKSRQLAMDNLFKKTGEKLYKKDLSFFENLNDDSVSTFISNKKEMIKLNDESQNLKSENEKLEKYLKSRFNSNKQQKAEEKLRSEQDFIISERIAELNDLGSYLYKEKLGFNDKVMISLFASCDETHEKIIQLNDEIEKCKAELGIEKLDKEISEMKENIKELQISIEKSNSDIAEFNKEINQAKAEIRKLK
ncbi:MAG: hypothetical protein PF518_11715 [Spirochaetaceae bacterium]|jgi:DNA repair exonuclease SbcCD ATPase subunit|nr:hypothetical protein [Spirochaetaceae bacterium]